VGKSRPNPGEGEAIETRLVDASKAPEIRGAFFGLAWSMFTMALLSHPVGLLKFSFFVTGAYFSDWAAAQRDQKKKEVYVRASDLPSDAIGDVMHHARGSAASC
jgi:hypothetical protein